MKRLILFYSLLFIGLTVLYIILFHLPIFLAEKVLFYRGLLLMPIAIVLTIGVLFIFRNSWKHVRLESAVAGFIMAISLNLIFFVMFPVTFDRSVTMFLLNDLKVNAQITSCTGLSKEDMGNHLIQGYVLGQGAVDRRLREQSEIGMVEGTDQCIGLTPRAQKFLRFADIVSAVYGLRE